MRRVSRSNQKRRASSIDRSRKKEGLREVVQLSHISSPFLPQVGRARTAGGRDREREREAGLQIRSRPRRTATGRPGTDRTACMVAYAPSATHLRQGRDRAGEWKKEEDLARSEKAAGVGRFPRKIWFLARLLQGTCARPSALRAARGQTTMRPAHWWSKLWETGGHIHASLARMLFYETFLFLHWTTSEKDNYINYPIRYLSFEIPPHKPFCFKFHPLDSVARPPHTFIFWSILKYSHMINQFCTFFNLLEHFEVYSTYI
jgi:hypothetical protein